MLGPVYAIEWKNAARRVQKYSWRWLYVGILVIELVVLAYESLIRSRLDLAFIAESAVYLILAQQTALLFFAAPAFAAGSVTDEKRRGTLDFMLMTPLTSAEIVLGKWLGQATQLLHLISPGYFLIALFAGAFFDDARRVYLAIAEQIVLLYALTAFGIFASVLNRSTAKSIGGVYLCVATVLALEWAADVPILGPGVWPIFYPGEMRVREHMVALLALLLLVPAALGLAIWRLRPAHEQHQSAAARVLGRWWDRPPVGDAPMRWKERYIGDWLSVPIWRMLPRWAKCACLGVSVAIIAFAWPELETFMVLGCVQLIFSGLFVAIRAAGAITGEKEHLTWESLLTTHMDAYQIVRGKLWGQIDALRPYLFVYLVPALIAAGCAGIGSFLWIAYTWIASWVILYYLGAVGIATSAKATDTWRSIIITLTVGQVSTMFTTGLFVLILGCFLMIATTTFIMPTAMMYNVLLVIGSFLGLLWIFAQTEEVLQTAEQHLKRQWLT